MTVYVIQKFNDARGNWEDDAETFGEVEARRMLREARFEVGDVFGARMVKRRV